jgi:hypothetical protein
LDADHPENGVLIPCRNTRRRKQPTTQTKIRTEKATSGADRLIDRESVLTGGMAEAPSSAYVTDLLASTEGLALANAFMRIVQPKLRRRIVDLVQEIAGVDPELK